MLVHLSEEQFAELLAGSEDVFAVGHVEICSECRERLESWKGDVLRLRDDISFSSQRPGEYWSRQRVAISRQLDTMPRSAWSWNLGWTLASSFLTLCVLVLALINFRQSKPMIEPRGPEISDAALIADVEEHMTEELPEALQPAGLLVSEMDASRSQDVKVIRVSTQSTPVRKSK